MTNDNQTAPTTPDQPSLEDQRHKLQALLGQYHGLLATIIRELLSPSPGKPSPPSFSPETQELIDALSNTFASVSVAFGEAHAALNTGDHDEDLPDRGLDSNNIEPKDKGYPV